MNSIDSQTTDGRFDDLAGKEARDKIRELAEKAGVCFFCTDIRSGKPFSVRPMGQEEIDDAGHIWFLSASDSHKNAELEADPATQLLFQGGDYTPFMTLYGTTRISKDRNRIEDLWDANMKNWFTGGKDDPRITVLEFIPTEGYYWDTQHGSLVAFAKIAFGALTGQTADDSIQGELKP